jgi:hypothetical protein
MYWLSPVCNTFHCLSGVTDRTGFLEAETQVGPLVMLVCRPAYPSLPAPVSDCPIYRYTKYLNALK